MLVGKVEDHEPVLHHQFVKSALGDRPSLKISVGRRHLGPAECRDDLGPPLRVAGVDPGEALHHLTAQLNLSLKLSPGQARSFNLVQRDQLQLDLEREMTGLEFSDVSHLDGEVVGVMEQRGQSEDRLLQH